MEKFVTVRKLISTIQKNKYVVLVLLIGIVLMLLPSKKEDTAQVESTTKEVSILSVEERLTQILQQVEGAGEKVWLFAEGAGMASTSSPPRMRLMVARWLCSAELRAEKRSRRAGSQASCIPLLYFSMQSCSPLLRSFSRVVSFCVKVIKKLPFFGFAGVVFPKKGSFIHVF